MILGISLLFSGARNPGRCGLQFDAQMIRAIRGLLCCFHCKHVFGLWASSYWAMRWWKGRKNMKDWVSLGLSPLPGFQWQMKVYILGSPTKDITILVVTLKKGDNPKYHNDLAIYYLTIHLVHNEVVIRGSMCFFFRQKRRSGLRGSNDHWAAALWLHWHDGHQCHHFTPRFLWKRKGQNVADRNAEMDLEV